MTLLSHPDRSWNQGWGAGAKSGARCFWLLGAGAAWKKPGAGARAAWKKSREPAPQPCEKIKRIRKLYLSYSFLGKILSFTVKKDNYFTCFIFFCSFTLEAGAAWKKYQEPEPEPEPLGKKIRSRSCLKKKVWAGAAKKFASSPALAGTLKIWFNRRKTGRVYPLFWREEGWGVIDNLNHRIFGRPVGWSYTFFS